MGIRSISSLPLKKNHVVVKVSIFDLKSITNSVFLVSFGLLGADITAVFEELRVNGIVCDFRERDSIRTAAVPLYNTFQDVFNFVTLLKKIIDAHTK